MWRRWRLRWRSRWGRRELLLAQRRRRALPGRDRRHCRLQLEVERRDGGRGLVAADARDAVDAAVLVRVGGKVDPGVVGGDPRSRRHADELVGHQRLPQRDHLQVARREGHHRPPRVLGLLHERQPVLVAAALAAAHGARTAEVDQVAVRAQRVHALLVALVQRAAKHLRERREQGGLHELVVAHGARRHHAGPRDDERHAVAALDGEALVAAQRAARAVASRGRDAEATIVAREDRQRRLGAAVRGKPLEQRLELQVDLVDHVEVARRVAVAHRLAAEGARGRVRIVHALRVELQEERPRPPCAVVLAVRAHRVVDEVARRLHVQLAGPSRVEPEVAPRPLGVQLAQLAEGAVAVGVLRQEVLRVVVAGRLARLARRDGPRPRLRGGVVRQV